MMKRTHSSISALHQRWAKLENEHHELALAIAEVGIGSTAPASLRERQARLLLDIEAVIAEIRRASPTTTGDIVLSSTSCLTTRLTSPVTSPMMAQLITP